MYLDSKSPAAAWRPAVLLSVVSRSWQSSRIACPPYI